LAEYLSVLGEVLPGVGHFVTDQDPGAVTRALLSHLARHR
jgi:pimeloyl-ACP methyl ester carboxylesterase